MRIALVEWNWMGHHPAYFNHLVLAFEELGVEVLALCANPEEAAATARKTRSQSAASDPHRAQTVFVKVKMPARRFSGLRPVRISSIDLAIRIFTGIERQVRAWSRQSGGRVDAIFYNCIYDGEFEWFHYARPFLKIPWLGLYVHALSYRMPGQPHPRHGRLPRPDKLFAGRLCKGIAILDEEIAERVSRSLGKPVVALPDLTDERLPARAEDRVLGAQLKQFAAGRPVVGLFGHLQRSKGLLTFLEAARASVASEVCFALGGEIFWPSFVAEAGLIKSTLAACPNLWLHLERIPEEPQLNDLMAASDVVFAAYLDFPHSSGIQTKAAVLKKPLIVSEGYLMAERTRRYHLGEVIPQGNAPALLAAIKKITQIPGAWVADNQPQWAEFCREHSFARLKEKLKELVALV